MTVSRTSLAVLAAALIATGAQAQTGDSGGAATAPPRTLGQPLPAAEETTPPPDQEPPATKGSDADQAPDIDTSDLKSDLPEPAKASSAKQGKPPVDAAPLVPPEPPKPSIQVETLGTVEGPAEGLLDPSNGGMDENIWSGSQRSDIETLLPRLPLSSPDTVIRGLSKKLILTKADAPAGTIKRALITIRIEKLLDAGLTDEAAALAVSASVKDDPDFARIQADAILSAGRAGDACGNATSSRLSEGSQFWLQLRAYCAAAAGDGATAEMAEITPQHPRCRAIERSRLQHADRGRAHQGQETAGSDRQADVDASVPPAQGGPSGRRRGRQASGHGRQSSSAARSTQSAGGASCRRRTRREDRGRDRRRAESGARRADPCARPPRRRAGRGREAAFPRGPGIAAPCRAAGDPPSREGAIGASGPGAGR